MARQIELKLWLHVAVERGGAYTHGAALCSEVWMRRAWLDGVQPASKARQSVAQVAAPGSSCINVPRPGHA